MSSDKDFLTGEFLETRILIANSAIAAKQSALLRIQKKIDELHAQRDQIADDLYLARANRDNLIIKRWEEKKPSTPEWEFVLMCPPRISEIMEERAKKVLEDIGLFSAGVFERNQQRAVGVEVRSEMSDADLLQINNSLMIIFPHLYALTDGERAVIVSHNAPESFNLQIRQTISNGTISVVIFCYGKKVVEFFKSFTDALTFIRNNMTGNRYHLKSAKDI